MKIKNIYTLISLLAVSPTYAELTINGEEIGNDVIFTYDGSINTAGLSQFGSGIIDTEFEPADNEFAAGGNADIWEIPDLAISGTIGSGGDVSGVAIGDVIGILTSINDLLWLPAGYSSGEIISGTITFSNHTFSTMGITEENVVTYSWGTGPSAETITFSTVPEEENPQLNIESAILLHFETKNGSTYTIEESTDLENWEPVINDIQGDGSVKKYFFEISTPTKFYRIQ